MRTIFCFLIAHLTLLGLVSSPCRATGPVTEALLRPQLILDNFDADPHAGSAWQAPPSEAGSRAHLAIVSAPAAVGHGKALHLQYSFPAAARALAPAGLHAQAAALRVRLSLHDVDARAYDALVL